MLRAFFAAFLLLVAVTVRADFIGIFAGGGYWQGDMSGEVITGVHVDSDLGIAGDNANHLYVAFEHPIPVLPNLRLERTRVEDTGTGTLTRSFTFQGETFNVDESATTLIDLTHTDVTLYYEVVDVGMDIDLGLTARLFNGEVVVDNASLTQPARREVKGGLPMVYARGKFGLPFTGTYLGANINAISYSGNSVTDYALTVGWETENFILPEFGIEGGYRRMSVDGDEDDLDVNIDMDVDGFFVNLTAHF